MDRCVVVHNEEPHGYFGAPWGVRTGQHRLKSAGLDDRHGPSPILHDTALLFVYTDQIL